MPSNISQEVTDDFIRTAFERCPSGIIVVDKVGHITIVNQEVERMLGYSRAELVGESVDKLVPEPFAKGHATLREQYVSMPTQRRLGAGRELFARHKDGRNIPVEIGLSTIETSQGVFILGTMVDISERRQLEEQLRQTHKLEAIGNLASGIAHDFNNILLGIIGYTELALAGSASLPAAKTDLTVVLASAQRGRDLVNRILFFTRKHERVRGTTSLNLPISETIQLLRATLPPNIEIRQGFDPTTPCVVADAHELHQIAMNLATNAAHAMKEGGGILEIRVGPIHVDHRMAVAHPGMREGLYVHLCVSDTGTGIPNEVIDHIFEPFFTTKPQGEGTGLGLSVIHRIVRSLGGFVDVKTRAGEGTRFDVYIPAVMPSGSVENPSSFETPEKYRILLVDDEEILAHLGQRTLAAAGFAVTAYSSSLQALEDFQSRPDHYALLITDNTMPHMSGLELVAQIKALRPGMPVLMVSGIGESMSLEEIKARGISTLLSKPYLSTELITLVKRLVEPEGR